MKIFEHFLVLIVIPSFSFSFQNVSKISNFNQNNNQWMGLIFSPFNKPWIKCSPEDRLQSCYNSGMKSTSWWEYSPEEVKKQLSFISEFFSEISTYGVGTYQKPDGNYNQNWTEGIITAYIPTLTAQLNKDLNKLKLRIIVGIFMQSDYSSNWSSSETRNAIEAVVNANEVYPGTVSGISIHFDPSNMMKDDDIKDIIDILRKVKSAMNDSKLNGIKVGLRVTGCHIAFPQSNMRTEDGSKAYCKPTDKFCLDDRRYDVSPTIQSLIKESDFIICFLRPADSFFLEEASRKEISMSTVVSDVGTKFLGIQAAINSVLKNNSICELMGETGWPSEGVSDNKSPNNIHNLVNYWKIMGSWSRDNKFKMFMFEAFDEPWKISLGLDKPENVTRRDGICGSEASYGLWTRVVGSNNVTTYQNKMDLVNDEYDLEHFVDLNQNFTDECDQTIQLQLTTNKKESKLSMALATSFGLLGTFLLILIYLGCRLRSAKKSEIILSAKYKELFLYSLVEESPKASSITQSPIGSCPEGDCSSSNYEVIALRFPYDKKKYEMIKGSFQIDQSVTLGKGQCGTVYVGTLLNQDNPIAFKTTSSSSSVQDIKNLLSEIKILSYIGHHENIVSLIGAYTEKLERGIVYVALEYCSLGSLDTFLTKKGRYDQKIVPDSNRGSNTTCSNHYVTASIMESDNSGFQFDEPAKHHNSISYDFQTLLQWSFQITLGMEHLSMKNVIHADLAARNILLTSEKNIKITDFGLSKKLYCDVSSKTFDSDIPLPWRWMAPESLRHLNFSTASDIWSYGVTLWEIFSLGQVPFSGHAFCKQFVTDLENGDVGLEQPNLVDEEIWELMSQTWNPNPGKRPGFTDLKNRFQQIILLNKMEGQNQQKNNAAEKPWVYCQKSLHPVVYL